MDDETLHLRYLILITAVFCAVLIGYNAFYVPDASLSTVKVTVDSPQRTVGSAAAGEEYTPQPVSSGVSPPRPFAAAVPSSFSQNTVKKSVRSNPEGKVNLNTATVEQLENLNGIGEALAGRIVAYRNQHGPFRSAEDLKRVSGIGDKKYAEIEKFITVG